MTLFLIKPYKEKSILLNFMKLFSTDLTMRFIAFDTQASARTSHLLNILLHPMSIIMLPRLSRDDNVINCKVHFHYFLYICYFSLCILKSIPFLYIFFIHTYAQLEMILLTGNRFLINYIITKKHDALKL